VIQKWDTEDNSNNNNNKSRTFHELWISVRGSCLLNNPSKQLSPRTCTTSVWSYSTHHVGVIPVQFSHREDGRSRKTFLLFKLPHVARELCGDRGNG
jgi:hypothetical protein